MSLATCLKTNVKEHENAVLENVRFVLTDLLDCRSCCNRHRVVRWIQIVNGQQTRIQIDLERIGIVKAMFDGSEGDPQKRSRSSVLLVNF